MDQQNGNKWMNEWMKVKFHYKGSDSVKGEAAFACLWDRWWKNGVRMCATYGCECIVLQKE